MIRSCLQFSAIIFAVLISCSVIAGRVTAQTIKPGEPSAASKADQSIEGEALRVDNVPVKPAALRSGGAAASATSGVYDLIRVLFALLIVVALILILRVGVGRISSLSGSGKAGKLVTVLSRSMITPRQQILVLQVGKRLLVVGDSGGNMSPLCELTDPDEIALLIGQSRSSHDSASDRRTGSFGNIFRRAIDPFDQSSASEDQEPQETKSEPSVEPVSVEEVGGLLEKVRLLQRQFEVRSGGTRS